MGHKESNQTKFFLSIFGDIGKECRTRSDAAECGIVAYDQVLHCLFTDVGVKKNPLIDCSFEHQKLMLSFDGKENVLSIMLKDFAYLFLCGVYHLLVCAMFQFPPVVCTCKNVSTVKPV